MNNVLLILISTLSLQANAAVEQLNCSYDSSANTPNFHYVIDRSKSKLSLLYPATQERNTPELIPVNIAFWENPSAPKVSDVIRTVNAPIMIEIHLHEDANGQIRFEAIYEHKPWAFRHFGKGTCE